MSAVHRAARRYRADMLPLSVRLLDVPMVRIGCIRNNVACNLPGCPVVCDHPPPGPESIGACISGVGTS